MLRDQDIREALRLSIEDGQLSRLEREEVRSWIEAANHDLSKRALYQSMAFDLANAAIESKTLPHFSALNWLEKVVKALAPIPVAIATSHLTEALFTPEHNCAGRIVELFKAARVSADICVFTITDDRLSEAIIHAHRRGVKMRIVTDNDKCFDPGSDIDRFRAAGIGVRVDRTEYHMHHKFAIFDGSILLSGSYNWTRSASQLNEENLLLTTEKRLVEPFRELFERLWKSFA
jgi:phosphatidylserine/phosphatidylglycerophosphate/cardiolipin synthase-like enzyme